MKIERRDILIGIGAIMGTAIIGVTALMAGEYSDSDGELNSSEIDKIVRDLKELNEELKKILARDLATRSKSVIEIFDESIKKIKQSVKDAKGTHDEILFVLTEDIENLCKEIDQLVDFLEDKEKFPRIIQGARDYIKKTNKNVIISNEGDLFDGTAEHNLKVVEEKRKEIIEQLRNLKFAIRDIPNEEEEKKINGLRGNSDVVKEFYKCRDLLMKDPNKVVDHKSDEAKALQDALKKTGYYNGEVNGKYSTGTRVAHINFLTQLKSVSAMGGKDKLTGGEQAVATVFLKKLGYFDEEDEKRAKENPDVMSKSYVVNSGIIQMNINFRNNLPKPYWELEKNNK